MKKTLSRLNIVSAQSPKWKWEGGVHSTGTTTATTTTTITTTTTTTSDGGGGVGNTMIVVLLTIIILIIAVIKKFIFLNLFKYHRPTQESSRLFEHFVTIFQNNFLEGRKMRNIKRNNIQKKISEKSIFLSRLTACSERGRDI